MSRAGCGALLVAPAGLERRGRGDRVEIARREPFAGGQAFGGVGAYEKVVGRFHGELDPAHPMNRVIVDLDLAPRNARGRVEYSADFYLLRPVDLARGNGASSTTSTTGAPSWRWCQHNSARAGRRSRARPKHAGNGFLMRHGFSVVWSGWIPGRGHEAEGLRAQVPTARGADGPLEQIVWDDISFNNATTSEAKLAFAVADRRSATLYVRERATARR